MFGVFRRAFTVQRPGAGEFVNGIWTQGPETSLTLNGSLQPTGPEDLKSLPEGRRLATSYRLYTDFRLRSIEEDENNPDVVLVDGQRFEVANQYVWQNNIINHYKTLIVREMKK